VVRFVTKRYILYIQQTCLKGQIGTYTARNTLVQLLALYTNAESHNVQRHRQTDGRQDDANSRSYYVAVRSAKNKRAVQNLAKSQCNDADWWINHLITVYFPHDFESRLTIEQFYRTFITFHWPMVQCAHALQTKIYINMHFLHHKYDLLYKIPPASAGLRP